MSYTKGGQSQKGYWHTGEITKQELYEQVKKKSEKDPKASVTSMLEKLNISKSGYYDYLKRKPCNQKIRRTKLVVRIKEIHKESKEILDRLH